MNNYILVIDDDASFRSYLTKMLTKKGYFVEAHSDGINALDGINCLSPDIVITDIIMPDIDGLEVIRRIKEKFPEIKIIAISGGDSIEPDFYLSIASKLKVDYILKKPFKKADLLDKIGTLLETENNNKKMFRNVNL